MNRPVMELLVPSEVELESGDFVPNQGPQSCEADSAHPRCDSPLVGVLW